MKFCRIDGALLVGTTSESQQTLILPTLEQRTVDTTGLHTAGARAKLSQITFDEAIEEYPTWSPAGDELFFSRERAGLRKIFRKNIVTGEEAG